MKTVYTNKFNSPLGWIYTAETDKGLIMISLGRRAKSRFDDFLKENDCRVISGGKENKKAERQIKAYLDGRLTKFDLKLDRGGTAFQKLALNKVIAIPYGKVKTYGQIAAAINRPGAARAVGSANASNLLPLVIPCHRVVAANGLGGYAGDVKIKERLLKLEGAVE